jgi:hypothetical protein
VNGFAAGAISFVVLCAADLLILVVLRQFVEGEAVFDLILLGMLLLALTAAGALIFGVYVGAGRYRKKKRALRKPLSLLQTDPLPPLDENK